MNSQTWIDSVLLEELVTSTDITFVGELIDAYCEETPRYIAMMKDAFIASDAEAFRRAAHTIKSTSATLFRLSSITSCVAIVFLSFFP